MIRSYDEDLYQALLDVSPNFDEAIWLQDHIRISHEERDLFLANEIENPKFCYRAQTPRVDNLKKIDTFNQHLDKSKSHAVVIDLYKRKSEKQYSRNGLIAASLAGNDEVFYEESCELYGKPRMKYFSYVAKRVLELCHKQKTKHPGSARRLSRVMAKITAPDSNIDAGILPPVVTNGRLIRSTNEVRDIFQATLDRCGIEGWTILIDVEGKQNRFSVNPATLTISIPSYEQLLARPKLPTDIHIQALAEHEVGVHVRRAYEARQGKLRLLEVGLDSYLQGEEGVASYAQQQIEGADEYYGFDRYLASSLAVGIDGEPRDFRAVFSLMTDYYTLCLKKNDEIDSAPFRAAWDVCVRIFRGTTGQTAGCIFTKDIVYMEGNIGIWNLLSEKPQVFESLFLGKYNPLLPRHVQTLQTLEILKEW